jgi:RNA polymerase sigma factor (sigma-70 family)
MSRIVLENLIRHLRLKAGTAEAAGLEDHRLLQRFIDRRDEAAFALLVHRHGPMVLGVCQRLLSNVHDCEDAFQATFLVLVRKAASLRKRELLANWLYGVARRTALKARSQSARRYARQRQLTDVPATDDCAGDADQLALRAVIDEELSRLPAKYRAPVVLCYLEGKTFAEAAVQLGWPMGTVSGRLARARNLLRKRLARRKIAVSTGWESLMLQPASPLQVSNLLTNSTIKAAVALGGGAIAAPSAVPVSVALLTEGVINAMFLTKVKIIATVVAVGLTSASSSLYVSARIMGKPSEGMADSVMQEPPPLAPPGVPVPQVKPVSPFEDKAAREVLYGAGNLEYPFAGLSEEQASQLLVKLDQPPKIKSILQQLFEAANVEAHARWNDYVAGLGTLDIFLGGSRRLLEVERLLSKEKSHQVGALERYLRRMRELEKINQARYDAGRIAIQDLAEPRYYRLQAELWLEQEKVK